MASSISGTNNVSPIRPFAEPIGHPPAQDPTLLKEISMLFSEEQQTITPSSPFMRLWGEATIDSFLNNHFAKVCCDTYCDMLNLFPPNLDFHGPLFQEFPENVKEKLTNGYCPLSVQMPNGEYALFLFIQKREKEINC